MTGPWSPEPTAGKEVPLRKPLQLGALALLALGVHAPAAAQSKSVYCAGKELPLILRSGGSAPFVDVKLEGKTGPFLIDYGYGSTVIEHGLWTFPDNDKRWDDGPKPHETIKLKGFGFPGWNANTEIRFGERNGNNLIAGRPQHGVVGIDLLVMQDLVFHYEDRAKPRVVVSKYGGSCDAATLKKEGFQLIGQIGHWDSNVSKPPDGVYNGPVAYIELADAAKPDVRLGAAAWAQLDTGYEDDVRPYSVDINDAMLAKLLALNPPVTEVGKMNVTGCDRQSHERRIFEAPGRLLRIEDETGKKLAEVSTFTFILKNRNENCGGISGTMEPAAQLGASYLKLFRTTIFRGPAKEVWIKP